MKTDKWFYELFLSQPGMIAELMPGIDPGWEYIYSAPVVKEKEFRLDGVFQPVSNNPRIPMVFAEAQMQADVRFYGRYFCQLFTYLHQYEIPRAWQGLLILQNRDQKLGAELPYQYLLDRRVTRLYLSDLKEMEALTPNLALLKLLVTEQDQIAKLGKGLLKGAETEVEFERRLSLIETILANKFPDLTKEVIMQILDLKKMDITRSRFYQEIRAEAIDEGRQEGRQEGEASLLIRLLKRRLGKLSDGQVAQIRQLSVPQLESLGEALLDFTDMADLEQFLAGLG
jgi:predicted transposase/invertase (TIGR01784 family)